MSITYFTGRHSNAARDDFKSGEMSSTIPCQDYWCDSFAGTEVQTHRTHSLSLSPFFFLLFSRSSLFSHLVSLSLSHLVSLFSLPSLLLSRPVSERERDRKQLSILLDFSLHGCVHAVTQFCEHTNTGFIVLLRYSEALLHAR